MLYIIPAWYRENTWNENEQTWYTRHMRSEADDSVKQIQLLHRHSVMPYRVLVLNYAPNLRHFLHRQGLYRAPYWSVFDAIQEVTGRSAAVLSYKDLAWPDNMEFIYSPFAIVAKMDGAKAAQIEFGEDGNMIYVDAYDKGHIITRYIYDDRGFISSTITYENGRPAFQDFLDRNGETKLRHFLEDDHVEINPANPAYMIEKDGGSEKHDFAKDRYDSFEEVIEEVLETYMAGIDKTDIFCVAMHARHSRVLEKALADRKYVLSVFEDRFSIPDHPECRKFIENAGYIVADEENNLEKIRSVPGIELKRSSCISPYDTREDKGISEQLEVENILIPIDGLENEDFEKIVGVIADYYEKHPRIRAHLFTRKPDYERISVIEEQIAEFLRRRGYDAQALRNEISCVTENQFDIVELRDKIFIVDQCIVEHQISKCLKEQRIILDLRKHMDLYLQVSAVSMGIPVIAGNATSFVVDDKNARIVKDSIELPAALDHFLGRLNNWNKAHIQSYEIGKKYTTEVLADKWKGVMKTLA